MDERYSTYEIEKIIEKGSVRKKAQLYLRDRTAMIPEGTEYILNVGVPDRLLASVSPDDREKFNEIICWGFRVESSLCDLYYIFSQLIKARALLNEALKRRKYLVDMERWSNAFLYSQMGNTETIERILGETSIKPLYDDDQRKEIRFTLAKLLTTDRPQDLSDCEIIVSENGYVLAKCNDLDSKIDQNIKSLRAEISLLWEIFSIRNTAIRVLIKNGSKYPEVPEYNEIIDSFKETIAKESEPIFSLNKGEDPSIPVLRSLRREEDDTLKAVNIKKESILNHLKHI